jgi:HlyD family secretion protein
MRLPLLLLLPAVACSRSGDTFHGWAEADEVRVGPLGTGILQTLSVERGQRVDAGTPLFAQDSAAERAARDQAAAKLAQAQAQLQNLEAGGRASELDVAQAQVREARTALQLARADLQRSEELAAGGATTRQQLDQARSVAAQSADRLHAAEARLRTLQTSVGRVQEIVAQRAAVDSARAALAEAEWRLQQRSAVAPASGLVVDTFYRPGEVVPAGSAVLSLLPVGALRVRFFVPETELGRLPVGARVRVTCDGCPAPLEATVSYVSPSPEFTPPVVFTGEARHKLSFLVEARSAALDMLHPGQPLDVTVVR